MEGTVVKELMIPPYLSRDEAVARVRCVFLMVNADNQLKPCRHCGGSNATLLFDTDRIAVKAEGCCEAAKADVRKQFEKDWKDSTKPARKR